MPQIIEGMRHLKIGKMTELKGRIQPNMVSVRRYFPTIARSGVIGTGVGALPGVGEDVAGWVSYDVGRSVSKEGGKFGKGSLEGLLSSGGANNACIGGALFPLLVLGIPGTPSAAALMGAFKINNIIPGPTIDPDIILRVVAFMPLMRGNAVTSRLQEEDCHQFDVCTDPDHPFEVFLYEFYTDKAAFDHNMRITSRSMDSM